eukprot:scaffold131114_cov20-Prasinocladus_malaysianus.AAC.1
MKIENGESISSSRLNGQRSRTRIDRHGKYRQYSCEVEWWLHSQVTQSDRSILADANGCCTLLLTVTYLHVLCRLCPGAARAEDLTQLLED